MLRYLFFLPFLPLQAICQTVTPLPNPARLAGLSAGVSLSAYGNVCVVDYSDAASDRVIKLLAVKAFNPDILVSYYLQKGWLFDVSYGIGYSGAVSLEASEEVGSSTTWSLAMSRLSGRVTKRWALGNGRWALGPRMGYIHNFIETGNRGSDASNTQPIVFTRPWEGSYTFRYQDLRRYNAPGYELGGELSHQLSRRNTVALAAFYTNTFSNRFIARITLTYDRMGVSQPPLVSQTKLEAWVVGVTWRYLLFPSHRFEIKAIDFR